MCDFMFILNIGIFTDFSVNWGRILKILLFVWKTVFSMSHRHQVRICSADHMKIEGNPQTSVFVELSQWKVLG